MDDWFRRQSAPCLANNLLLYLVCYKEGEVRPAADETVCSQSAKQQSELLLLPAPDIFHRQQIRN
jgi:hypothetical protein